MIIYNVFVPISLKSGVLATNPYSSVCSYQTSGKRITIFPVLLSGCYRLPVNLLTGRFVREARACSRLTDIVGLIWLADAFNYRMLFFTFKLLLVTRWSSSKQEHCSYLPDLVTKSSLKVKYICACRDPTLTHQCRAVFFFLTVNHHVKHHVWKTGRKTTVNHHVKHRKLAEICICIYAT